MKWHKTSIIGDYTGAIIVIFLARAQIEQNDYVSLLFLLYFPVPPLKLYIQLT